MKKIILTLSLLTISPLLCMEKESEPKIIINKNTLPFYSNQDIFRYLSLHCIPPQNRTYNPCEKVEQLIKMNIDPNQTNPNHASFFHGWTALEVAITQAKCPKCANLLKQHGAQETKQSNMGEYIIQYKLNEKNSK